MRELIVFIVSAGPNVFEKNIEETYKTLVKNLNNVPCDFYVVVDKPKMDIFVRELMGESIVEVVPTEGSWALDFNRFMNEYCKPKLYQYLIVMHDDILVDSFDFYSHTLHEIKGYEDKIAWITYTNTGFHSVHASNSVRGGIYRDRSKFDAFECHSKDKMDYPIGPVIVYGPFSHFNLIKTNSMIKVGPCENWTPYTMLIDEDWSLEALTKGFVNVWIPNVFYRHPNPNQVGLRTSDLRFRNEAHRSFRAKWGFNQEPPDAEIAWILKKYPELSYLHRDSYDWIYLHDHPKE